MSKSAGWTVITLGLVALGALWTTGIDIPQRDWTLPFLLGYVVAWTCYLAAAILLSRSTRVPRWVLLWVVLVSVCLRLICLARTPRELSTDVWRYLWDGRVSNAGVNPYRYPPNAPELRHLRDANWTGINHKHISTIYPPAAQVLFAALARSRSSDAQAFRWSFAAFDLASVLVLIALLRRTGRPPHRAIWYAWCPLAATEVTAGAHVDAFGVFLLLAALLLAARAGGRPGIAAGVGLAGSVMAKGYPLLAVPFFARHARSRFLIAFAVTSLALLARYLGAGKQLFAGLEAYLHAWKINSSIFLLLYHLLQDATSDHYWKTRLITTAIIVSIVGVLTWRQKPGMESLLRSTFAAFGAQVFIGAPTYPWYVLWLLPALCWWSIPGVALFTLTVSLQYYARELWPQNGTAYLRLLWAGYVPVYALLIGQFVCWLVARRHPPREGQS